MAHRLPITAALLLLALLPHVFGHTYFSSLVIGGKALTEGTCMRPHPATFKENPIPLVTQADMTCGWLPEASTPAAQKCAISAGSSIGLQWYHTSPSPSDDIIAASHVGPCLVYLAKSDTGAGPVWFKIYEDGYDATTETWCTTKLIANRGLLTVTLPSDIAPGNYLLRGEILALHSANVLNGVQPYVGCAELTISGSGTANPAGVAIPGVYSDTHPGMLFNIYTTYTSYPIPGPSVYKSSGSQSTSTPIAPAQTTTAPSAAPTNAAPIKSTPAPADSTTAPIQSTAAPTAAATAKASTTSAPTQAVQATGAQTATPMRIQLYPSSSQWWIAVTTRSTPTVTSISFKDSGVYSSWLPMQTTNWGYSIFAATNGQGFTLPISLQLTAVDGSVAELPNVFTLWTQTTFMDFTALFAQAKAPRSVEELEEVQQVEEVEAVQADDAEPQEADESQEAEEIEEEIKEYEETQEESQDVEEAQYSEDTQDGEESQNNDEAQEEDDYQEDQEFQEPEEDDSTEQDDSSSSNDPDNINATPIVVSGVTAPTVPPSASIKVMMHEGSSEWWVAIDITNSKMNIEYVEMRDMSAGSAWYGLDESDWGYWIYTTSGKPLVAPLAFRLTALNGRSVTFMMNELTPNTFIDTGVQFL